MKEEALAGSKDAALKLALEALEEQIRMANGWQSPAEAKAITAIKAALAQQEPWCMKMNGCTSKCEDCPVEVVEQEPVAKYSDIVSDGGLDPRNKFDAPPQPPQRKPLTHAQTKALIDKYGNDSFNLVFQTEAAHGIKEKNT